MKKDIQQIIGYILGGLLVWLIIPYGIYSGAKYFDKMEEEFEREIKHV